MASTKVYRILLGSEVQLQLNLAADSPVDAVIQEVKRCQGLGPDKIVRVVCGGRELYPNDPVSKAGSMRVLHVIISEAATAERTTGEVPDEAPAVPPPVPVEPPPPVDWLDMIDPSTLLMFIFGAALVLLWALFLLYSHMFDRTSVIILSIMTVAFFIPIVLSYLPVPPLLQPYVQPYGSPQPYGQPQHAGATGSFGPGPGMAPGPGAVLRTGYPFDPQHPLQQPYGQGYGYGTEVIPPRPPARVRPPAPAPGAPAPAPAPAPAGPARS